MELKKTLPKYSIALIMLMFFSYGNAQNDDTIAVKELDFLSKAQMQILKEQQQLLDDRKDLFKANLTQEQLTVLNDRKLSMQDRKQILKKSLTENQRNSVSQLSMTLKSKRAAFRKSLTMRQKSRLKRFLLKRNIKDRRRLLRRLRMLIQNNMNN